MWSAIRKSKSRSLLRRTRLGRFERLETRWCPAAPTITSFAASVGPGHSVTLTGQVADENPGMVMVQFEGAVNAILFTNPQGQFTYTTQNCQLGTVTAKAKDMEMLWSQPVTADITSAVPVISNLTVVESGPERQVTISGTVTDEDPEGILVSITGKVTANGSPDASGNFSITATATELGDVTVTATDPWGLEDVEIGTITSNAPAIVDLVIEQDGHDYWFIRGRIVDEFPAYLTVFFGGVLAGYFQTADHRGIFEITVHSPEEGEAYVSVYDWWGIQSQLVWFDIG